jgi:hypothetical protein
MQLVYQWLQSLPQEQTPQHKAYQQGQERQQQHTGV